ncbi:glycosyltransferase involved in cell wall biosynthesis [Carboxydothermus ferrireducens DSM 11255]|uniref:Glycosyltransferase involved in cell wall biosynthesis n=1 Tax=Carboxydothermus ferrireducens DSM 11255 TaxID=1119529 RepID=A0ABX2RBK0_9THEO|nr:glycosyltransferase involved in cell wall biosynthesis [Carboxydothermus ferrireducens DSM 11255]
MKRVIWLSGKVKVLQVMRPSAGGIKKHVFSLLQKKSGDFAFGFAGELTEAEQKTLKDLGVTYYSVAIPAGISLKGDLKACYSLYRIIKKEGYRIVHCHGFKAALAGRMAAFLAGVPVVYTVHNSIWHENVAAFKRIVASLIERFLTKFYTHKVIAVSENLKKELILKHGVLAEKITVIPNGVEIPEEIKTTPHQPVVIGTLARFAPQKGLNYLLEALALLSARGVVFRAIIGGDGPLKNELKELAKELGIESLVTFPGYIPNPAEFYREIDIFVLPSISEGLPLSLLEAMSWKLAVIATNVGGIPEVINSGENGLLVPPKDATALTEALYTLIFNENFRLSLGERAYITVREKYNVAHMAQRNEEIYRGLLT